MSHTRCNYCGQVVQFIDIRGNNTCPICRQSSTSCCEGGSCNITPTVKTNTNTETNFTETVASATANTSSNTIAQNQAVVSV